MKMILLKRPAFFAYLVIAAIFVTDLLLVEDFGNVSFLYLLPLFVGIFFKEKNDALLLGVVVTVLTVLCALIKPQTDMVENLLFNRGASILGIWAGVYLVIQILKMKENGSDQDEQFQALFNFASNGILIVNQFGTIEKYNKAAATLFGYTEDALIGRKIETLIPSRYHRNHERHHSNYRSDPQPRSMGSGMTLSGLKKDNAEFPVEISLSPFKTKKGNYTVAFVIDNTLRTENENRIIRQNQRLEQLAADLQNLNENLEERIRERTRALELARNELSIALGKERELGELKSRFVSMASHEFRTPLSTVLSSAALVATYADRADLANIKKHAARIKHSVNGLNTILTEFLSLGKLDEGKTHVNLESIDLEECVTNVSAELNGLLKPGQVFNYEHSGEKLVVLDPGLLRLMLINLISNAIKYSPEATPITVRTSRQDGRVILEVTDQGIGIPEADQKHLFTRFFRATNSSNVQGTGLGLYIVRRYVELMNGRIACESTLGKGTTMRVVLEPE